MTPIRAILFDFDGTLTAPGAIDFPALRRAVGCADGVDILAHLESLSPAARRAAEEEIDRLEQGYAAKSLPNDGAEDLVAQAREQDLPLGILTRNSRSAVDAALGNFAAVSVADFSIIITRDDQYPPKPDASGVLAAAAHFGVEPGELLMVGDYVYDIMAGAAAGAQTAFVSDGRRDVPTDPVPDWAIRSLAELVPLLES